MQWVNVVRNFARRHTELNVFECRPDVEAHESFCVADGVAYRSPFLFQVSNRSSGRLQRASIRDQGGSVIRRQVVAKDVELVRECGPHVELADPGDLWRLNVACVANSRACGQTDFQAGTVHNEPRVRFATNKSVEQVIFETSQDAEDFRRGC